jgi:O-succinylbenzoate synthase
MRVDRVELLQVRLPLIREFETSSHRKSYLEHVLVRVEDAGGAVGWGEIASPSGPFFCGETVDTCWTIATAHLVPRLLGAEWEHPAQVPLLWARVRGNEFAKAGLDMACWALWAQATGVPLAAALGGERRDVVVGVSLGIEPTVDALLEQVARHVEAGYARVKLKIAPGWDVEPVAAVRAAYPDLQLHVDANGAYTENEDHLTELRALDGERLLMIEQPFAPRNLMAAARLQAVIDTPVCLDESVVDGHDLETALAVGACRVLNIKVSRMGGLTAAVAAHDLASEHGIPVWCGGMYEFGVGRAANLAISSLPGFVLPSDVSGSDKYYTRDVVTPPIRAEGGTVRVPWDTPGLGHDVDEEFVRAHATRAHEAAAGDDL